MSEAAASARSTPTRAAMLVIHGIGEPQRYQALDAFARGLAHQLEVEKEHLEHHIVWRDGRLVSMVRLRPPAPVGRHGATALDLFELYWAGSVLGRISPWQVLRWIARTSLTPLRSFSQNPEVLFCERGAIQQPLRIFLRELLRAGLLVSAAALAVLPFLYAAYRWDAVVEAGRQVATALGSVEHPIALACWLAVVAFALAILNEWRKIPPPTGYGRSIERRSMRWWRGASAASLVVLVLVAWLVHATFDLQVPGLVARFWSAIRPWPVLLPLLAALALLLLRRSLVLYVGDIVLYATADERSEYFRTRQEILEAASGRLRSLLRDEAYDAVYVAGHSLGSVIAYDAINDLIAEVRADSPAASHLTRAQLSRLQGLLTFGSPLDKVYYFFRIQVGQEEAIRAQLLASLYGFRRVPSGHDYGDLKLAPYEILEPEGFVWLNVHSAADLLSGHLDFYRVDTQRTRPYVNPLTAHLRYWTDSAFYAEVVAWM